MTVNKGLQAAVREVKGTLTKLILFDTLINAILVFLFGLLFFSLFSLPLAYPIGVSSAYLVFFMRKRLAQNKIRMVETKYKSMDEKLRTAAEYQDPQNPVIKELHSEVLKDLRSVEESAFVNEKRIYMKSIAIVILSFVILLLSPFTFGLIDVNLNVVDAQQPVADDGPVPGDSGSSKIKFAVGNEDTGLRKASDEIYGTATVAQLGDDEIKVRISPAGTELSIRELQESDLPDFSESYPTGEAIAVAAESFEEEIPKEDLELVKGYFTRLASG